eukprot:CAMPEP_0203912966 /NCGR_PEP_ID=MMETSP0359-20131031/54004_1 /ASSEMBLY_ACC=CAM_ASM_000338 /TAXON_ID=268821 /ORGANISM="Scrippsiella Hangoei, Strain SHTV-5" /LENGTH=41 /DNA_ID= /DNA_START= /DNA_END= /DNA_ORIENTATION=
MKSRAREGAGLSQGGLLFSSYACVADAGTPKPSFASRCLRA